MQLRQRLGNLCIRLATIAIVAGVLLSLPDPQNGDVVRFKNAAVVLFALILMGKALFDTFFYERHQ